MRNIQLLVSPPAKTSVSAAEGLTSAPESMAPLRPVKSLGPYATDWTIKVRLTTKGKLKSFKKKTDGSSSSLLPLEFVDGDGTQITATLFGRGVDRYNVILEEGKCYFVSKGTVKIATKKYTSITNDFAISLDDASEIKLAADDAQIKHKAFNFTPIQKIQTMETGTLVDVIGIVHEVGQASSLTLKDGNTTVKRVIKIYDEGKDLISLTLWRDLAEGAFAEKEIIGLKNVRVTEFNGKQLSTIWDTTLLKNPSDDRLPALQEMYVPREYTVMYRLKSNSAPASVQKFREPLAVRLGKVTRWYS